MYMYTAKQLAAMTRNQLMNVADDLGLDFEPSEPLIDLIQRKYESIGAEEAEAFDLVQQFKGVPVYVLEDFEAIRSSGVINMFDRRGFEQTCSSDTLAWLTTGKSPRKNYGTLLTIVGDYMRMKRGE